MRMKSWPSAVFGAFICGAMFVPAVRAEEQAILSAPAAEERAAAEKGAPADKPKAAGPENPWLKIPPVRPFPRLGFFQNPPTDPGYYSFEDCVHGGWREKPPKFPYPPSAAFAFSFFDADFRYLDDPKNTQHDCFDCLHRIHLDCDWLLNAGGEFRYRHAHEVNSRLFNNAVTGGRTNNYDLFRERIYGDLWYRDSFRIYAEFLDAVSFNEDLPPLVIDEDRADLLNLFVDVKLCEIDCKPVYVRVGRQELLLGSERLISPLDWANTRRTFEGVRAFRQGEKFDVDVFWVQPVIPDDHRFDRVDENIDFAGVWTTYRPRKGVFFDNYYLVMSNDNSLSPVPGIGIQRPPFTVHTLGSRYAGDKDQWLWDVEGMVQFGERSEQEILAGAVAVGGGYHFKCYPMNPTFWIYYDFASGDNDPDGGDYNTFNQQFAFGHYYMGWLDLVGRQNIHDLNVHLYLHPTNWITVWFQFHHFELAEAGDALYNAAGAPIRRDATGAAGRDVGDELDIVVNFHLSAHSDIMIGYSHLFAGDFIKQTAAGGPASPRAKDPELLFMMYSFRW